MRRNHTHLRSKLIQAHDHSWARILTAVLVLATTAANVGAIGFLLLCPVRGMAEAEDCCCCEVETVEATAPTPDDCACGRVLLVEDNSEGVLRVSSEFDFAPLTLTVETPWITSPEPDALDSCSKRSPPRARSRPAYLLFSSWTC